MAFWILFQKAPGVKEKEEYRMKLIFLTNTAAYTRLCFVTMATHVSYSLSIECLENNLAPSQFEWGLTVHTYLTSHFERAAVASRVDVGKPAANVQVKGKLPFEAKGQIPATAAICFYATAYHHNDNDVPVIVGIGTSHIFLGEIQGTFSADPKQHERMLRRIGSKSTATATTFTKEVRQNCA